ncbi:unnamed protein product [Mytilus coruscus]|uniref:Uncharacterized protein n=1 Tax=Mytilus coruscus TaxID=42192 RepID=A0A6J8A8C8_MYTCO|nr:unnamed protein product [Mytilus coruscus]
MKEYNNSVESVSNIENHTEVIHSDCAFESNKIQDETVATNTSDIMDIEDNQSEASATGKELSVLFNCVNSKTDNNVNKNKHRLSIDRIERNNCHAKEDDVFSELTFRKTNNSDILSATSKRVQSCNRLKENNDKCKQIFTSKLATDIKLIPKFVLKQARGCNDIVRKNIEKKSDIVLYRS